MSNHVFKLLYCSRNFIAGDESQCEKEIDQILRTARVNNRNKDITGALLFNSGYFAQVLEGPRTAVEQTFEKIQRDSRHGDVTVLESVTTEQRDFPAWSMAQVRPMSEEQSSDISAALDQASVNPEGAGVDVLALLRTLVVQED